MRLHNRMLKVGFWTDTDLLKEDRDLRLFYVGLWCIAEDSGCVEDEPFALKLLLFPSPADSDLDEAHIEGLRDRLVDMGKLVPYEVAGRKYLYIRNFHRHQSLGHPGPPEIPLPPWVTWVPSETPRRSGEYRHECPGSTQDSCDMAKGASLQDSDTTVAEQSQGSDCPVTNIIEFNSVKLEDESAPNECTSLAPNLQASAAASESDGEEKTADQHWKQYTGRKLGTQQSRIVDDYRCKGFSDAVIIAAMNRAFRAGAGLQYACKVLDKWREKGFSTLEDVEREAQQFHGRGSSSSDVPQHLRQDYV